MLQQRTGESWSVLWLTQICRSSAIFWSCVSRHCETPSQPDPADYVFSLQRMFAISTWWSTSRQLRRHSSQTEVHSSTTKATLWMSSAPLLVPCPTSASRFESPAARTALVIEQVWNLLRLPQILVDGRPIKAVCEQTDEKKRIGSSNIAILKARLAHDSLGCSMIYLTSGTRMGDRGALRGLGSFVWIRRTTAAVRGWVGALRGDRHNEHHSTERMSVFVPWKSHQILKAASRNLFQQINPYLNAKTRARSWRTKTTFVSSALCTRTRGWRERECIGREPSLDRTRRWITAKKSDTSASISFRNRWIEMKFLFP